MRRSGSWAEQFSLLFRDYMRTHQEDAARYAELKRRLAAQYGEDRLGYTEAKEPFIWEVMRRPPYYRGQNLRYESCGPLMGATKLRRLRAGRMPVQFD